MLNEKCGLFVFDISRIFTKTCMFVGGPGLFIFHKFYQLRLGVLSFEPLYKGSLAMNTHPFIVNRMKGE